MFPAFTTRAHFSSSAFWKAPSSAGVMPPGSMPWATSLGTDLAAIAKGAGIACALRIGHIGQVADVAAQIAARGGPVFAQVLIAPAEPPRALPPRDGSYVKNRFRAHLGLAPF